MKRSERTDYLNRDILFLSGDFEAQKLSCSPGIDVTRFLIRHFLYSVLLAPKVSMPSGCYLESRATQCIVYRYKGLYQPYKNSPECAELSIGDDRKSFAEDVQVKRSWFPEDFTVADKTESERLIDYISDIRPGFRTGKMRTSLAANIFEDISENGSARKALEDTLGSAQQAAKLIKPLQTVIEKQEFAMLPPYIQIEMERHGLSAHYGQKRWLDFILFMDYAKSCEAVYKSYCNNPLSIFYDSAFRIIYPYHLDYRDTNLFECFLQIFPFPKLEKIEELDYIQLIDIKNSEEFRIYADCYKELVGGLKDELQAVILDGRPEYDEFKNIFVRQRKKEFCQLKSQLVNTIQDSIILYKALRNPFFRDGRFKKWIKGNISEMPTVQVLSCIKDGKNGILREYIRELFWMSKHVVQNERRMGMKKNLNLGLINVNVNQKIDSDNVEVKDSQRNVILQEEFKAIHQEKLEKFLQEISKETDMEILGAKKAFLQVMNAKYASTAEEYQSYLTDWKKEKSGFSEKVKSAFAVASQAAGIMSFVLKLMEI